MLTSIKPYNLSQYNQKRDKADTTLNKTCKKSCRNENKLPLSLSFGERLITTNPNVAPEPSDFIIDLELPEPIIYKHKDRNTITSVSIDNHIDEIDRAKGKVEGRNEWRDFIIWRNNRCRLNEKSVGMVMLKDKQENKVTTLEVTSYKFTIRNSTYQDFLLRTMDNKLRGYISLSIQNDGNEPYILINRLISFDDNISGIGTNLLQTAIEASHLKGCKGRVRLKAKHFTKDDSSPVGFYYKNGFRAVQDGLNPQIQEQLDDEEQCSLDNIDMHLPGENIQGWGEKIRQKPILEITKIALQKNRNHLGMITPSHKAGSSLTRITN